MAFSFHPNERIRMLKRAVNFQSLSKLANTNINRACWMGGDTQNTPSRTNLMIQIQTKAKTLGHIENNCEALGC